MTEASQRVLTVEEAARVLRISRSAAYRAVKSGEIPVLRVGHALRVPAHRLRELLGEGPDAEATPAAVDEHADQVAAR